MRRLVTVNPYNFTNWQKFNNSYDCFLRYFLGIFYDWFYVSRACFDSSISSKVGRVLVLDRDPKLIDFKKNEYELLHKPDLTLQEYRKERVQIIVSVCNPKPIILNEVFFRFNLDSTEEHHNFYVPQDEKEFQTMRRAVSETCVDFLCMDLTDGDGMLELGQAIFLYGISPATPPEQTFSSIGWNASLAEEKARIDGNRQFHFTTPPTV